MQQVSPLRPEHEVIDWDEDTGRCYVVRVRDQTCSCVRVSYEFCQGGGRYFIRCLSRDLGRVLIWESAHTDYADAKELWKRLINGEAR